MPMCKVILPGSASLFFETIFQIAAFQIYDIGDHINDMLSLEPTDPFNQNFENIGLESMYVLNNMGTMVLFYVAYPLFMLFEWVCKKCRESCLCCLRLHRKVKRALYYSALLTGMFESYSLLAVCCFIALPVLSFGSYGEIVQSAVCIFFTIFIFTGPYIVIKFVASRYQILKTS